MSDFPARKACVYRGGIRLCHDALVLWPTGLEGFLEKCTCSRIDTITERENAEERIRVFGPGLELLRRCCVEQLQAHMDAFYEHGSAADLFALCLAFDRLERTSEQGSAGTQNEASLIESILLTLAISPDNLLD